MNNSQLSALQVLQTGPVIPVLVIDHADRAVPLARALLQGGVRVLEVTLRTACALEAISKIAKEVPEAIIGAGTVTNIQQFNEAEAAGAKFIISPGLTDSLLNYASRSDVPFIPGVSTVSELMRGKDAGLNAFKFFPAEANGGTQALKALASPFPSVSFCPTGGITPQNARHYLALPNVVCVGGSWLATAQDLRENNYQRITALAGATAELAISEA